MKLFLRKKKKKERKKREKEKEEISKQISKAYMDGRRQINISSKTSPTALKALRESGCKVVSVTEDSRLTDSFILKHYQVSREM